MFKSCVKNSICFKKDDQQKKWFAITRDKDYQIMEAEYKSDDNTD